MREIIRQSLLSLAPSTLIDGLLAELDQMECRFAASDFRPTEISGGRFGEYAFRICEHVVLGSHTQINQQLPRTDKLLVSLENAPKSLTDETFRTHIPRSIKLIYDLRSKRDVAHLGATVSPNVADSHLVVVVAHWIVAECVRVAHKCDLTTAQRIVDAIVQRETSIVWTNGSITRILDPDMRMSDRVLVVMFARNPEIISDSELQTAVEYSSLKNFKGQVLRPLHEAAMIDYRDGKVTLLPPGMNKAIQIARNARKN